jgi:tetratricopeptide (TPR) repeat protein
VHVARGQLGGAADVLDRGLSREDAGRVGDSRYPGSGLHWLLGMVRWAVDGNGAVARHQFDMELTSRGNALYAAEYSMNAYDGLGFLALEEGRAADADAMFARALAAYPEHPRSLIGRAMARDALKETTRARALFEHADRAIQELAAHGSRAGESMVARACQLVASGDPEEACRTLESMLEAAPPGSTGWTLPLEPWLAPIRDTPACQRVFAKLAERAS